MQIGEFAKLCNTKVSILRYYDKEGVLIPDFIDPFSGYRYYSKKQVKLFLKISALKKAGFSLTEIKQILKFSQNSQDILHLLENKKQDLKKAIQNLEEAKKMLLGGSTMTNVIFQQIENNIQAQSAITDTEPLDKAYETMEHEIFLQGYQRISSYSVCQNSSLHSVDLECKVIKLSDELIEPHENINLPFEDDQTVIGKWKVLGEYAVKEDFWKNQLANKKHFGNLVKEIFFLPKGESYWCYGWTKGKLLIDTGTCSYANEYTTELYNGKRYMFVDLKSYSYFHGGIPTVLVLEQLDNTAYSSDEIARKDDLAMPFVSDKEVLGKWKSCNFVRTKEEFEESVRNHSPLNPSSFFFRSIEFFENGHCTSVYGDETISGDHMQVWTKGYVLRKYNHTACRYEIKTIDTIDYLIMEWKSGDYRWGGFDTDYYVFVRA